MLKGLTEIFRRFGFTFENIKLWFLSFCSEILRKDTYVGELIYKKPNSIFQLFNKLEILLIRSHHESPSLREITNFVANKYWGRPREFNQITLLYNMELETKIRQLINVHYYY